MSLRELMTQSAAAYDRVRPPTTGITVLLYHRVGGGTDSQVDLPIDDFDRQMALLATEFHVLSLDAAAEALTSGGTLPAKAVAVTFDDGTADFVEVAAPILERHSVPATLYVATHYVDTGQPFPWRAPPATWAGLRDAITSGLITLGSHTHTHRLLHTATHDEVVEELDRSIHSLNERVQQPVRHFAYPKAVLGSPLAEVEVRRRFITASVAGSRANPPGRDLHRLWRTPVQRRDNLAMFRHKASGGMRLEGAARELLARRRYRSAVR